MIDENGEYKFNLYKLNLCHKKCKEKVENEMKKNTKKIFFCCNIGNLCFWNYFEFV